jgi:hypothetical protein
MQALPQKTTDYIAEQFRAYFARKAQPHGMTYIDARTVIDYLSVAGPAPEPSGSGAIDYAKPRVSGSGGRKRPSQQQFERIIDKYAIEVDDARWNDVFNTLIEGLSSGSLKGFKGNESKKALRFIKLAYQLQLKPDEIWSKMHVTERTYKAYRLAILTAAYICAVQKGCTLDT